MYNYNRDDSNDTNGNGDGVVDFEDAIDDGNDRLNDSCDDNDDNVCVDNDNDDNDVMI